MPALRQANRANAAELLSRAIHSYEVMLEGRRDDEAHAIREQAPKREQLAEILMLAEKILKELGQEERAAAVGRLAGQIRGREQR